METTKPELTTSESHPRLLDIDSSLEKINQVERNGESQAVSFNLDRTIVNETKEVVKKFFFVFYYIFNQQQKI